MAVPAWLWARTVIAGLGIAGLGIAGLGIGRLVAGVLADGVLLLRVGLGRARMAPVPVVLIRVPIALVGRGLGSVRLVALLTVPVFVVPLRGVAPVPPEPLASPAEANPPESAGPGRPCWPR